MTGNPRSRFDLIELAYRKLKEYGLHTHYILSACEVAYSIYRNKKGESIPHVTKAFLKLDSESYRLNHLVLRIPSTPRHFIYLTLRGSDYHLSYIDDPTLKRGSITVNEHAVCIAFSKQVKLLEPRGYIGMDVNERNVTISDTNGHERRFAELGEVADIKERYREIRAKIQRGVNHDYRIGKRLLAKYGRREKNRTLQRIHKFTKEIVKHAEKHRLGIKMERLTGIRRRYRKWNNLGKSYRGRMNTWVFGEAERQTSYKAKWEGVPVYRVNPRGTSRNCPDCGSPVVPLQDRKLYCSRCDKTWDRDDLASKNIMACVVPQDRPPKGSSEKERGDDGSIPSSGWEEVRLTGVNQSNAKQNHSICSPLEE